MVDIGLISVVGSMPRHGIAGHRLGRYFTLTDDINSFILTFVFPSRIKLYRGWDLSIWSTFKLLAAGHELSAFVSMQS